MRLLILSCALLVAADGHAGEWALTGLARNETTMRWQAGRDLSRSEWSLDLFANYTFNEQLQLHLQPRLYYDATWDYCQDDDPLSKRVCPHQALAQRYAYPRRGTTADPLREAYLDWTQENFSLRLGKQQVVWGTADGIKLLDIINPSDFREFYQNTFEDFRVTLWMAKGEWRLGEEQALQWVWVPDVKANQYPGLDAGGDVGHPFVFKGIDAITGPVYGFAPLAGRLGTLASGLSQQLGQPAPGQWAAQTVFNTGVLMPGVGLNPAITQAIGQLKLPSAAYEAALLSAGDGRTDSLFEITALATFETNLNFAGLTSRYQRRYPNSLTLEASNLGLRWKGKSGPTRYSLNYYYHWSNDPQVGLHYEAGGQPVTPVYARQPNASGAPLSITGFQGADGQIYSGSPAHPSNASDQTPAGDALSLVFTERLHRVHSLGGSFDSQLETRWGPVVLRGEVLLNLDDRQPVVDFGYAAVGDLAAGLRQEPADYLRYVIGLDRTFLRNLFTSVQFIQFINLDYVDAPSAAQDSLGATVLNPVTGEAYRRVSADFATVNLSNGLRAGARYQNFFSLYLATSALNERLRLSNLLLADADGGYWDQFQLSYDSSDQLTYTLESNLYFGTEDSLLGQFAGRGSGLTLGVRYAF